MKVIKQGYLSEYVFNTAEAPGMGESFKERWIRLEVPNMAFKKIMKDFLMNVKRFITN